MFWVYVLYSEARKRKYIGMTGNLPRRVQAHNQGKSRYTKYGIPWKLVYHEEYKTKREAMEREKFFKSGHGREILERLLKL